MSKTYPMIKEGEWEAPPRTGFRFMCCDCGLIHRMNFRIVPHANGGKSIEFQIFRDNRGTGQAHRQMDSRAKTKAEK